MRPTVRRAVVAPEGPGTRVGLEVDTLAVGEVEQLARSAQPAEERARERAPDVAERRVVDDGEPAPG